jgi:excisionase family DNA binding protein
MCSSTRNAYLTVPQVAAELDISTDGVYKLIKRGKLPAIRRSERGMRVSRVAFDSYQRRLRHSETPATPIPKPNIDVDLLNAEFERETGLTPRTWERRWKAEEIEDSAENMRLAIRALTLNLAEQHKPADRHSTAPGKPRETIHAR